MLTRDASLKVPTSLKSTTGTLPERASALMDAAHPNVMNRPEDGADARFVSMAVRDLRSLVLTSVLSGAQGVTRAASYVCPFPLPPFPRAEHVSG